MHHICMRCTKNVFPPLYLDGTSRELGKFSQMNLEYLFYIYNLT